MDYWNGLCPSHCRGHGMNKTAWKGNTCTYELELNDGPKSTALLTSCHRKDKKADADGTEPIAACTLWKHINSASLNFSISRMRTEEHFYCWIHFAWYIAQGEVDIACAASQPVETVPLVCKERILRDRNSQLSIPGKSFKAVVDILGIIRREEEAAKQRAKTKVTICSLLPHA